jgi:hypothetical protein
LSAEISVVSPQQKHPMRSHPVKMSVGVLDHYNVSTRKLDETVTVL